MNRRGSIFGRLLAGALLAVLVPVAIGFGVAWWAVGELAENEARARLAAVGERKARQLDAYLAERLADANVTRRSAIVQDALAEVTGHRPPPVRVGRRGPIPPTAVAVAHDHLKALALAGGCVDAFLMTTNGEVVLSAVGRPELGGNLAGPTLKDSALTRAVLAARNAGQVVLSDFRVHQPTGRLCLFAVGPIHGPASGQQGFFALEIPASAIHGLLREESEGARGVDCLLAASERDHVFLLSPARDPRVPPPGSAVFAKAIEPATALATALKGGTGVGRKPDLLRREVFTWWGPVPRLHAVLTVGWEPEEVLAPMRAARKRLLTVGGLTLAFSLLAIWVVARGAARPIEDLAAGAESASAGDAEARTAVADGTEVGRISELFDQTLERLHAATAAKGDLERQRQELRQRNEQLEEWVRAMTADRDRRGGPGTV